MTTHASPRPASLGLRARDLTIPALLLILGLVPALGGVARLASLAAPATPESARFVASPVPIAVHVVGATLYSLLGAFQFSTALRRRAPAWHRRAGKLLAACGLASALTGLWMAAALTIPLGLQGPPLQATRVVVGVAMAIAIVLGVQAIRRRDVAGHEAWMIRAYALGLGAGTQVLVLGPWMLLTGQREGTTRDVLMIASWAINAVVAEVLLRKRTKPSGDLLPSSSAA